jgi:hypothetical protein
MQKTTVILISQKMIRDGLLANLSIPFVLHLIHDYELIYALVGCVLPWI